MGIAIEHDRRDGCDRSRSASCRRMRRSIGTTYIDPLAHQELLVGFLGSSKRIAHRNVLVALDIDHRIHLHQTSSILERHEIGWLSINVDEERERGIVLKMLDPDLRLSA